jgi:acetamidase/formamidase
MRDKPKKGGFGPGKDEKNCEIHSTSKIPRGKTHIINKWHPVYRFNSKDPIILNINPGDILIIGTPFINDAQRPWGPNTTLEEFDKTHWRGHPLFGPIFIKGAEPGYMIEVRILNVKPAPWALTFINLPWKSGTSFLPHEFKQLYLRRYNDIDTDKGILRFSSDVEIPIAPFMGQMAVAPPAEKGTLSTRPPRQFGGNIDWNFLIKGSTLYLPSFNKGGLFYVGDGHIAQGDGEVATSAAETDNTVTLQFFVRKDRKIEWPEAENSQYYATTGFHRSLKKAAQIALQNMIIYLVDVKGLPSKEEALCLCTLAVEMRIIEVVNGNSGVAVLVPKSIFKSGK